MPTQAKAWRATTRSETHARRAALAMWASATLVAPVSAQAFEVTKTDRGDLVAWQQEEVEVYVDPGAEETANPATPDVGGAMQAALSAWELRQAQRPLTRVASIPVENGVRTITDWPYEQQALAVTVFRYQKSDGKMVSGDILINGEKCFVPGAAERCFDLTTVLTHELGHFWGLSHVEEVSEAVMHPSLSPGEERAPSADDYAGLQALYGAPEEAPMGPAVTGARPSSGVVRGGCSAVADGSLPGAALATGIWLAAQLLRRRAWLLAAGLLLIAPLSARASSRSELERRATLEDAVDRASHVFVGRPVASRTYVDPMLGHAVTEHTIAVDECRVGVCDERVYFLSLGGEIDGIVTVVDGETAPVMGVPQLFLAREAAPELGPLLRAARFGLGVFSFDPTEERVQGRTDFTRETLERLLSLRERSAVHPK